MYEIQKLDFAHLNAQTLMAYKNLIAPKFHHYLSLQPHPYQDVIVIGATKDKIPVGIALAVNQMKERTADLHTLYVLPSHRHQHVGNRLLQKVELELKKTNCFLVFVLYPLETPSTQDFENLLKKHEWFQPHPYIFTYYFQEKSFHPLWFQMTPKLASGIEIFFFKDLNHEEKKQLKKLYATDALSHLSHPFDNDELIINHPNSLVLRDQEKIIGWIITHKINPETIRYTSLFIHPDYPKRYAIRLLIEALRLQVLSGEPIGCFKVNLYATSPNWHKFIKNRLQPLSTEIKKIYRSWKQIG